MFAKIKYGIGTKVNVIYDPELRNELPVLIDQKLGYLYETKLLDPKLTVYIPIGPKPLSMKENDAS